MTQDQPTNAPSSAAAGSTGLPLNRNSQARSSQAPGKPSAFYRARVWRLGVWLAAVLPHGIAVAVARGITTVYLALRPVRLDVVIRNLLPALSGDRPAAGRAARSLFRNFARKLVDLWRYEAGKPVAGMFSEWTGWEHFVAAQKSGKGILLLTPHLGNWEFGAPLLAERGVNLLVLTLEEPGTRLTELRRAARARWGIETLVVGSDPFAFVEVIRRLEGGAIVALLVDRPPAASSTSVQLFGETFGASIAAAELARAAGCILLPVFLPLTDRGYSAHILPEIRYERAALRSRESRRDLTQEIMRAFEPHIRQYPDQWYHFVPVWPAGV